MTQVAQARKMPRQKPGRSKQDVETPKDFMRAVEKRFGLMDYDLAATYENTKAPRFYGPVGTPLNHHPDNEGCIGVDSLKQDWTMLRGNLWLNPEYGDIAPWAEKCAYAYHMQGAQFSTPKPIRRIFLLVPASVGSNWWAKYVHDKALVLFTSPRIKFVGHTQSFPKDIALCVFGVKPDYDIWRWK